MPRELQAEVHSNTSLRVGPLKAQRLDIYNLYDTVIPKVDFDNHLFREFNRKVSTAGFGVLAFSPFDGGYRYTGSDLDGKFGVQQSSAISLAGFSGTVS
jgi:hypothetical protein